MTLASEGCCQSPTTHTVYEERLQCSVAAACLDRGTASLADVCNQLTALDTVHTCCL